MQTCAAGSEAHTHTPIRPWSVSVCFRLLWVNQPCLESSAMQSLVWGGNRSLQLWPRASSHTLICAWNDASCRALRMLISCNPQPLPHDRLDRFISNSYWTVIKTSVRYSWERQPRFPLFPSPVKACFAWHAQISNWVSMLYMSSWFIQMQLCK